MNEDFVTYELAVKLKEKGFDAPCYGYYHCNGGNDSFELCGNGDCDFHNSRNRYRVAAPTIAQVLKWLREEKKIHIVIDFNGSMGWYYQIALYGLTTYEKESEHKYNSYEQAALAGIEYYLEI